MKVSRSDRRVRSAVNNVVEMLEPRQLLSATLVSAIPAQTVMAGGAGAQIALSTYLNDPSINGGTVIEMQTPLGNIPLELTNTATPLTVANFVQYINNGDYQPTIFQRLSAGFVLQGGGTKPDGTTITSLGTVTSESGTSNTTGTIAMALSSGPDSGTNQWFINLANNNSGSTDLDNTTDGGPFTVFGNVIDGGMTVVTNIAALQTINGSAENSNWYVGSAGNGSIDGLPVINYTGSSTPTTVPQANLVTDNIVELTGTAAAPTYTAVSADPSIITASVSNGELVLAAASGVTSGSTTVTATVTDLSGATATSTFDVDINTPTVTIANASATVGAATQVVFPVTLSAANTSAVTLDYTLAPGTAVAGDFTATGSTLTIPAGSTTANIPVNIAGDSLGASENFTITLSDLSSGVSFAGGGTTASATGTILPVAGTTAPTTTTLQASAPAIAAGAAETFVATVAPSVTATTPTGTVTFSIGGTSIGIAGISDGTATLTTTLQTPGAQVVTAVYSGSSTYAASTSASVTVNVSTLAPVIAKSTLPATVVTGAKARGIVLVTATNSIATTQKGIATFNIYATSTGVIDAASILLGTTKRSVRLTSGSSVTVPVLIKSLPSTLTAGTYTLLAQTQDALANTSFAGTGPTLTLAAPVVSLAESFVKIARFNDSVLAGSKTSSVALLKITNSGNVASVGVTSITLYASSDGTIAMGTAFKTLSRRLAIGAGRSVTAAVPLGTFPLAADGSYSIVAQVTDPTGGLSTAVYSTPITIAPAKIDLANTIAAIPATAKVGKSIPVTIDLANNGNIPAAGALQIAFSASTSSDGSNPVTLETVTTHINVHANHVQTLHLRVSIPVGTPSGNLYLVADADPSNLFDDIDLTNNTAISVGFIAVT
jgi:cyclophilin family peptidyl-prolyl cis-trans isomerase